MRKFTLHASLGIALILTCLVPAHLQENLPEKMGGAAKQQRQAEGRPAPDVIGHWRAFAARNGKQLAVSWNPQTGTPESIFGDMSDSRQSLREIRARFHERQRRAVQDEAWT